MNFVIIAHKILHKCLCVKAKMNCFQCCNDVTFRSQYSTLNVTEFFFYYYFYYFTRKSVKSD